MSKARWSDDDMKKAGLVQGPDGTYVPVKSLAAKGKVSKLPALNVRTVETFPPVNKKIMGATKSVNDAGVKFDSALERFMYDLLTGAGIDFDFQVEYLLQEKFRYRGEAIRPITLTVDFFLPAYNKIIDTKGWANDVAPIKIKLLKWHLFDKSVNDQIALCKPIDLSVLPSIELPSTKKECQELLNRLLYDKK